ncbi:MAG: hypothetical protein A4S08_12750 [Proteobacteria bacterium SG_bin4]|nr:MAG: hypothetical protein A4S08_12750 [Proteobacteria bacterium SG_bin4]
MFIESYFWIEWCCVDVIALFIVFYNHANSQLNSIILNSRRVLLQSGVVATHRMNLPWRHSKLLIIYLKNIPVRDDEAK